MGNLPQLGEGNKPIMQMCAGTTEAQQMLTRILLANAIFTKVFRINYEQNAILLLLVLLFIDLF